MPELVCVEERRKERRMLLMAAVTPENHENDELDAVNADAGKDSRLAMPSC